MPSITTCRRSANSAMPESSQQSPAPEHDITKYPALRVPKKISEYLEIRNVRNKGKGIYLRKNWNIVSPGTVLLQEAPLIVIETESNQPIAVSLEHLESAYAAITEQDKKKLAHLYWGERENQWKPSNQNENNLLDRSKFCG